MKIKPIEINCKDKRKFQDIALLVDREDFLKDLKKARKKVEIISDKIAKGLSSYPELREFMVPLGIFVDVVRPLCKKYKYRISFAPAIRSAILNGKIEDEDLKNCYGDVINPQIFEKPPAIYPRKTEIVIRVCIKRHIKHLLRELAAEADSAIKSAQIKNHPMLLDTISNIRRDRKWYWQHKKGKSYTEIAREEEKKTGVNLFNLRESVIKAIKQYKKRLSVEI